MKYEYLGLAKTVRIGGKKYNLEPGEEYSFTHDPGPSFRKVAPAKKQEKIANGTES